MEIAKFVLTAIGTFVSVSALSFTVFQFWAKRRDEKDAAFRKAVQDNIESERVLSRQEITDERASRKDDVRRLEGRVEKLESIVTEGLIDRLSKLEGEMKGIRNILDSIQSWFINNTKKGA